MEKLGKNCYREFYCERESSATHKSLTYNNNYIVKNNTGVILVASNRSYKKSKMGENLTHSKQSFYDLHHI